MRERDASGIQPLLTPAAVEGARCDACGGRARYVLFTLGRGYGYPREGDVAVVLTCDCTEHECNRDNHPFESRESCVELGHRTGYGPILLTEFIDATEGHDWALHLRSKVWWHDGGRAAFRARFPEARVVGNEGAA